MVSSYKCVLMKNNYIPTNTHCLQVKEDIQNVAKMYIQ